MEKVIVMKCTLYGHKKGCRGYYDPKCDIYGKKKRKKRFGGD